MRKPIDNFWDVKGKISREEFNKFFISIIFLLALITFLTSKFEYHSITKLSILFAYIIISIQCIKRLHDLNLKGWIHFASLIPFINLVYFLFLFLASGNKNHSKSKN